MSENGSNNWNVSFGSISFLNKILSTHGNVKNILRSKDILFTLERINKIEKLKIVCLEEYCVGVTIMRRVIEEFGRVDIIYSGGEWTGYTPEAKELCISEKIGLYNSKELSGGLWKNEFWNYNKRDEKGDTISYCKTG